MLTQNLLTLARLETFLSPHYFASDVYKEQLAESTKDITGFIRQLERRTVIGKEPSTNKPIIFKLVTFSFSKESIFFTGSWAAVCQNGLWLHPQTTDISEQEPMSAVLIYQTISGEGKTINFPPDEVEDIDIETHYIIF